MKNQNPSHESQYTFNLKSNQINTRKQKWFVETINHKVTLLVRTIYHSPFFFFLIPWRRVSQPTPVFLPGQFAWTEVPGGLQPMGAKEMDMND